MAKNKQEHINTDDAVLLMFLNLIEEDGIEVDVTLNMNGAIVSGTLIGAGAYYDGITEASKNLEDSTMSKIISKKFHDLKEAYQKQKEANEENEEGEVTPNFIHLKNATYLVSNNGQTVSKENKAWWRGRITSIDGFSFNNLT